MESSTVRDIDPDRRGRLREEALAIFCQSFDFPHLDVVAERVVFRSPDARLHLLRDEAGQLVGFASTSMHEERVGRRVRVVMNMGMYVAPGVRGAGPRAVRIALLELLRAKLRRPFVPVCFVGEATSPVAYRVATRIFAIVHPSRNASTPAFVEDLVRRSARRRGLEHVDGDPWRVKAPGPFRFRRLDRMKQIARSSDDPNVRFYVERNPDYADGEWLMVHVPLDGEQAWAHLRDLPRRLRAVSRSLVLRAARPRPSTA